MIIFFYSVLSVYTVVPQQSQNSNVSHVLQNSLCRLIVSGFM